jgi:class 3 adenylate cyclase/tetratricopeptide (TPR) repeat protein
MHCNLCDFESPAGNVYCGGCGAELVRACAVCGTVNPIRFRFCGGCGSALLPASNVPRPAAGEDAGAPAERRHLTVMFCDLVGSTSLSMQLDPEELREVVRSYQSICADAIERFGGYVAQYLGDGVLAYFGYPVALENEAERAVQAGLRVVRSTQELSRGMGDPAIELAVRVGVHTGVVVMGEVGAGARRERLALGGTPNIAARLQAVAAPNSVAISAVTQRLIQRTFECEDLGTAPLKGVAGVGSVYRVLRERPRTRAAGDVKALIGRDEARNGLMQAWESAVRQRGRVVTVVGDAGIGKTRLIDDFFERIDGALHLAFTASCLPYYQNTAMHPFVDLLEREIGREPGQSAEATLDALAAMLERDEFVVEETLPLFAALLGVPLSAANKLPNLSPQTQRERTRNALQQLIVRAAETCPVVLVVEDLHWADPSTVEFLHLVANEIREHRVLLLLTARCGFGAPWENLDHAERITLGRLRRSEVESLTLRFAGKPLPAEVLQQVVAKTDGVPLFVEELCKMIVQSGMLEEVGGRWLLREPLPPLAIPATLHDSLEARLDRLAAVKELAQIGATLGREFSHSLLRAVAGLDDATLQLAIDRLVEADVLTVEGEPPDAMYMFRHALIQEAAYQSLLRSARQRHHLRVAQVLAHEFTETAQLKPELLAHHYTAAGLPAQAIPCWLLAGRSALGASAHAEAIAHLKRGLELIPELPAGRDRDRQELALRATLGPTLLAIKGYTDREVREEFARAQRLCERIGDDPATGPVLTGLFGFHVVRGEVQAATALAMDIRRLGDDTDDADIRMVGDLAAGIALLVGGEMRSARQYLATARATYNRVRHAGVTVQYGHDIGVLAAGYEAILLWTTGYVESALERAAESIALAREVQHPYSLAFALALYGVQLRYRHDPVRMIPVTAELLAITRDWGFIYWQAEATLMEGWILAAEGNPEAAFDRVAASLGMFRSRGVEVQPYYLITEAEISVAAGRPDRALAVLDASVAIEESRGEPVWWSSELYRLRGELLDDDATAERDLWRAIHQSQRMNTRSLELRAALALARRLERRDRGDEAVDILRPRLQAMPEGHGEPDYRSAANLIAAIESNRAAGVVR